MSIDKEGFLSEDIAGWIEKHRNDNYQWFELAEKVNRIGNSLMYKLQIYSENGKQVIAAALFVRILGFYQASLLLSERGMINESKVILRSMLNATFIICAITNSEEVLQDYVKEDIHHRIKALRKIKDNPHFFNQEFYKEVENEVNNLLDQLVRERDEHKPKKLTVQYLAKKANMLDFYNTAYSLFSDTEHASARDLEQYLILNEKKEIKGFKWGPSVAGIDRLLLTAIETLTYAIQCIEKIFDIKESHIKRIIEKISVLSKDISEDTNIV